MVASTAKILTVSDLSGYSKMLSTDKYTGKLRNVKRPGPVAILATLCFALANVSGSQDANLTTLRLLPADNDCGGKCDVPKSTRRRLPGPPPPPLDRIFGKPGDDSRKRAERAGYRWISQHSRDIQISHRPKSKKKIPPPRNATKLLARAKEAGVSVRYDLCQKVFPRGARFQETPFHALGMMRYISLRSDDPVTLTKHILDTLREKGYNVSQSKFLGCGNFKDVFSITKNGLGYVAKVSYGADNIRIHNEEIDDQDNYEDKYKGLILKYADCYEDNRVDDGYFMEIQEQGTDAIDVFRNLSPKNRDDFHERMKRLRDDIRTPICQKCMAVPMRLAEENYGRAATDKEMAREAAILKNDEELCEECDGMTGKLAMTGYLVGIETDFAYKNVAVMRNGRLLLIDLGSIFDYDPSKRAHFERMHPLVRPDDPRFDDM